MRRSAGHAQPFTPLPCSLHQYLPIPPLHVVPCSHVAPPPLFTSGQVQLLFTSGWVQLLFISGRVQLLFTFTLAYYYSKLGQIRNIPNMMHPCGMWHV